jgi:outer membrane protein assembly factor BamB
MKKIKKTFINCIVTGTVIVAAFAADAQEVIQWRYDRTGIYPDKGLLQSWADGGPQLLWHYDGLGEGHSSVSVSSSGTLYITGMTDGKGWLYAFSPDGKLLNKTEYGPEWNESYNGTRGTVTPDNDKLYLISGRGEIFCFNESDLSVVWKKSFAGDFGGDNIKWGICESPLIVGDKVIASPGKSNNIVALNKHTGELVWSCEGEGDLSAYCSPIYIGDLSIPLIVTHMQRHVIGIDVATGKKLWSFEHVNQHGVHPNVPLYADNQLLLTSGYGKGSVMLRLKDGGKNVEKLWEEPQLDSRLGATVKIGDCVYGSGDKNRYWFCLDWKTGTVKYKDNSFGTGDVIAADSKLFCYSDRGELALVNVNPEKFEIVSRFKVTLGTDQHWAHPVIYKGILYLHHGNTLMAYKIS